MVHYWLRHEVKPGEERVAITPREVTILLEKGFKVTVERSPTRCIPDEEYEKLGCEMAETGSWPKAPKDAVILGLKELPEDDSPLPHNHIFFAHCYKNQGGWEQVLSKFDRGGGLLWDLEFLVDDNGRRVAAFGRAAGLVGMAVGLLAWCERKLGSKLGKLSSWNSAQALVAEVSSQLAKVKQTPSILVVGALGRCGGGAVWFAEQCGLTPIKWDLEETKVGGPFKQFLDVDIVLNAIYLSTKIAPFLTREMLDEERKLTVLVDVSCDTSNPNNPFPFYKQCTTLFDPILTVVDGDNPMDVIAIDHLPSLVPTDSSAEFGSAIVPHLVNLQDRENPVWKRAEKLFHEKVALLPDHHRAKKQKAFL